MPTYQGDINSFFSTRINPWKFGEKKFEIDKVIQRLLKVTTPKEYKKHKVSMTRNYVNLLRLV